MSKIILTQDSSDNDPISGLLNTPGQFDNLHSFRDDYLAKEIASSEFTFLSSSEQTRINREFSNKVAKQLAGITESPGFIDRDKLDQVAPLSVPKENGAIHFYGLYTDYRHVLKDTGALKELIFELYESSPEEGSAAATLRDFIDYRPVEGAIVLDVYSQMLDPRSVVNRWLKHLGRPARGWYLEGMNLAVETGWQINTFFKKLDKYCKKADLRNRALVSSFLEAWRKDCFLTIFESICSLSGEVLSFCHFQGAEVNTKMLHAMPKDRTEEDVTNDISGLMSLKSLSVPKDAKPGMYINSWNNSVLLPTNYSFIDTIALLGYLQDFWETLASGMKLDSRYGSSRRKSVNFNDQYQIYIKPRGDQNGQARIAIIPGPGMKSYGVLQGFQMRVDKEEKFKRISIDFGRFEYGGIIEACKRFYSTRAEMPPKLSYGDLVDGRGNLRDFIWEGKVRNVDPSTASVMFNSPDLTSDEKISFTAALLAGSGSGLGIRRGGRFSYHYSGLVSNEAFYENFEAIAIGLKEAFTGEHPGKKKNGKKKHRKKKLRPTSV